MRKFLGVVLVLFFLAMVAPGARSDSVYTYTGGTDTYCSGTYASSGRSCSGPDSLSITVDTSLTCANCVIGLTQSGDLTSEIESFTITDGTGLSISNLTGSIVFDAATNGAGQIIAWWLYAQSNSDSPYYEAHSGSVPEFNIPFSYSYDYSDTFSDQNPNTGVYGQAGEGASSWPGLWTVTTTPGTGTYTNVPEPDCLVLTILGLGLILANAVVLRKRVRVALPEA